MPTQSDTPRKARIRTIPALAWASLEKWLGQAALYHQSGKAEHKPNPALLIEAANHWPALCAHGAELVTTYAEGPAIRTWHKKPKHKGEKSHRDLDPEAFAFMALAIVCGGILRLDPKGDTGQIFYPHLTVAGYRSDGKKRRALGLRVIAGTAAATHTVEPKENYHDLRSRNLVFRPPRRREPTGLHCDVDVRQWAIDRYREVAAERPNALPIGLSEDRYVQMLDVSRTLLRALPLGEMGGK